MYTLPIGGAYSTSRSSLSDSSVRRGSQNLSYLATKLKVIKHCQKYRACALLESCEYLQTARWTCSLSQRYWRSSTHFRNSSSSSAAVARSMLTQTTTTIVISNQLVIVKSCFVQSAATIVLLLPGQCLPSQQQQQQQQQQQFQISQSQ